MAVALNDCKHHFEVYDTGAMLRIWDQNIGSLQAPAVSGRPAACILWAAMPSFGAALGSSGWQEAQEPDSGYY